MVLFQFTELFNPVHYYRVCQGFHGMRASFPCTLECSEERFLSAVAEIKVLLHVCNNEFRQRVITLKGFRR